ncbi:MAG: LPS assembly protein LptD, partial [Desulfatitalea sp.]
MRQCKLFKNGLQPLFTLLGGWVVLTLVWMAGGPFNALAAEGDGSAPAWNVSADRLSYDPKTDEYTAEGNVTVTREGRTLTADMMRLNQTSRQAWAEGHVRLLSGQDTLTGKSLQMNLDNETGTLTEGSVFLSENHFYLSGREIQKTGPESYRIKDASLTSCDGPDPDWHITGKDLKVTIEGYGFITHAALWAEKVPVIYTPYLAFPVKLKRQSGLLTPEFGLSDRRGQEYLQPLFWAINDSMDATFFAHYMSERGTRLGGEYRYVAGEHARGTLMADGFEDRQVDDGLLDHSQRWGYTSDGALRPNQDRYWVRAKVDQNLPVGMTAKLDLDVVSDQDYLKEFQDGANGFDKTRDYFLKTFGRDIDDYNDGVRLNQLNLNRLWSNYTFNADARWYDDVVKRRTGGPDDTLQNLPELALDGTKQKIAGTPVYFDLLSDYSHFYRQEGTRGQRADLYPRIYYPTRLFNAVFVEPSAGIRQTAWHIDQWEATPAEDRDDYYRSIYDLKLDTSTDFFRVFSIDTAGCDRLKHGIKPQLIYEYIPDTDQEETAQFDFDELDVIEAQNRITFALTNTLTARTPRPAEAEAKGPGATYIPFVRFKLAESFDINKHKQDDPRPFSDLLAELGITPGRYLRLDGDALWRPYDGRFYGYNAGVRLWDLRDDVIGVGYRFTREEPEVNVAGVESIVLLGLLKVTQAWGLRGHYERNIEDKRLIETGVGLSYRAQCWGVDLDAKEEEEHNRSIAFMVHLTGLGTIG